MRLGPRALVALALVAVGLPGAGPAAAAPVPVPVAREYVTLSGSGIRSTLVRFDRTVDFAAGANWSGEFFHPHVTVSGAGVYGYAILPAKVGSDALGVLGLRLPSSEGTRTVIWPVGGGDEEFAFRPGVYRLVLLGGSGSVRFRLPGLRPGSTTLRPTVKVGGRIAAYTGSSPTAVYGAYDSYQGRGLTRFVDYLWYSGPAVVTDRTSDCYWVGRPAQAAYPGCVGGHSVSLIVTNPRPGYDTWGIGNTILPPGTWTVRTEVEMAGAIASAGAVFVWLDA